MVARIEATPKGLDIRYVVTSLQSPSPEEVYAKLYCARGQAENLIKLHKTQLKSKRSFCAGRSGLTSAFIQAARALTGCAAFQAQGMSSSIRLFVWPLTIRVRTSVR